MMGEAGTGPGRASIAASGSSGFRPKACFFCAKNQQTAVLGFKFLKNG
jgi:hypothetical protein